MTDARTEPTFGVPAWKKKRPPRQAEPLLRAEDLMTKDEMEREQIVASSGEITTPPKTSEELIRNKITETVDQVTNTVLSNISELRVQLDALEQAMVASCKATKEALEHHIHVSAKTLEAVKKIEEQVSTFRSDVQETTPNSPPQREDQKGRSETNAAGEDQAS